MGIGSFVANVGNRLNLPELGISEKLGGINTYSGTLPNGQQWLGQGKTYQEAEAKATQNNAARPTGGGGQPANIPASGASTGIYTGASGGGGAAADPNYDYLIDDQLSRLGNQQNVGLGNILGSYSAAFQTLMNNKARTNRDFDTQTDQTQQDNLKAKNTIDQGVKSNIVALSRLLGGKGAGNSSAATILAPFAAGVEGNTQRAQVQDTFGRNIGAITTARKDTNDQFDDAAGQLGVDRVNQENSLKAKIGDTRAQLLAAKGSPNLRGEISNLGRMVDALGATQSFTPKAVDTTAPDLSQYGFGTSNINADGSLAGGDGSLPGLGAYSVLLGASKKKQLAGV